MTTLADAYDALAEAAAALAIELRATAPQDASGDATAPSFDDLPPEDWGPGPLGQQNVATGGREHGSAAVCPSHNIPYRSGKFGSYCPSTSDDPKWSNDKGYCQITPKSAAAWLRQKATAG